ncbi:MAG TPA: hypothetical protein VN493_00230 [Thermoanaerobaculia bacterium]|nr:hypothetical protein [Thermoanaerobaculia bacterium]
MPGSKLESLGSLQRLNDALAANAGDLPQLEGSRAIYGGKVVQVNQLAQEQASLLANKQEVTRQFQYEMTETQRLATVLRLAVKHHYGIDSEKLVEFGIQPFRGRTRKVKETPDPETPPGLEAPAPAVVPDLTGL